VLWGAWVISVRLRRPFRGSRLPCDGAYSVQGPVCGPRWPCVGAQIMETGAEGVRAGSLACGA